MTKSAYKRVLLLAAIVVLAFVAPSTAAKASPQSVLQNKRAMLST